MAYDELTTLTRQKTYAKRAIGQLLCTKRKDIIDAFKSRIDDATSQNGISRVMADVRQAI